MIAVAREVEQRLSDKPWDITVAVMGCVVNGPGEASHADYGIAGGKGEGVLFKHGQSVGKVAVEHLADALVELIERENLH
jgi:(E)-4-hydroxy-3-methylbut-2-enyl-diphosphate synthase